jgi:hypothetical protein
MQSRPRPVAVVARSTRPGGGSQPDKTGKSAAQRKQTLTGEVAAWEADRNAHHAKADWQFTTADARIKLKRLYPQFE